MTESLLYLSCNNHLRPESKFLEELDPAFLVDILEEAGEEVDEAVDTVFGDFELHGRAQDIKILP